MKRALTLCAALLLLLTLACTAKTGSVPKEPDPVSVPNDPGLKLSLPIGARDDVAKPIPAYTAGFRAKDGGALTFTVSSADPAIAEGLLRGDGTLYVIAHGAGETKLTVTAENAAGEQGQATVSVAVRDGRRTLALIVLGVLSVALLCLLGKPSDRKAASKEASAPAEGKESKESAVLFAEEPAAKEEPEQQPEPTVIFEETNDDPERR